MSYDIRTRDNTDVPAPAAMRDDTDDSEPAAMDDDPAVTPTDTQPTDPVDEHTPDPVDEHISDPVDEHISDPVDEHTPDPVDEHISDPVDDEPDNPVEQPDEMAAPEHPAEPTDTGEAPDGEAHDHVAEPTDTGEGHEVLDPQEPSAEHPPMFAAVATDETAATAQPHPVLGRDLMPGDMAAQPVTALWPDQTVTDLRNRWQAAQLRFVDDPTAVAADMQALVGEAVQALSTALTDRQRDLDGWNQTEGHDTEQLRIVVQRYRDFLTLVLDQ